MIEKTYLNLLKDIMILMNNILILKLIIILYYFYLFGLYEFIKIKMFINNYNYLKGIILIN